MGLWKKIFFSVGTVSVAALVVCICYRSTYDTSGRNSHQFSLSQSSVVGPGPQLARIKTIANTTMPPSVVDSAAPEPSRANDQVIQHSHLVDDPDALTTAAGAIKLWEPQPANSKQRLAVAANSLAMWIPQSPSEFVRNCNGADASLVHWLASWQQQTLSEQFDVSSSMPQLESALARSRLTSQQCMQVMRVLEGWEAPGSNADVSYPPVSGAFACQAIFSAADEVKSDVRHYPNIVRSVSPLIRRLWFGRDADLKAVNQFYALLADHESKESADWFRGKIGQIEAMGKLGETDQALSAAGKLESDFSDMQEPQHAKLDYDKGIIYFNLSRFADAAKWFGPAAHSSGWSENRGDAHALLVISLARAGDTTNAQTEEESLRTSSDKTLLRGEAQLVLNAVRNNQGVQ